MINASGGLVLREYSNFDFPPDGMPLAPGAVSSYLGRVLYNRRSKQNPLWNQVEFCPNIFPTFIKEPPPPRHSSPHDT